MRAYTTSDTSIATTAIAISAVATHPSRCNRGLIMNVPMMSGRTAMSIISAMIGTAMTPLITAVQYRP